MNGTRQSAKETVARDVILASIRASLSASAPFDAEHRKHHGHEEGSPALQSVELSRDVVVGDFKKNIESVGGHCSLVSDMRAAANHVRNVIEQIGAKKIAISDSAMVSAVLGSVATPEVFSNADVETLFDCDLGITSAQWAIAETGTLVLESDVESHRLTSLVPAVHMCLVKASNIRQTLGEILESTSRELSRTITFITGASRTSDIELTLAIGVHGPGELHIIVIADQ